MTKLVDELHALADAIRSSGTYRSHHREECQLFLERLEAEFDDHVDYEEGDLFPELRPRVSESGDDAIDRAIAEHDEIGRLLDELARRADEIDPGREAESTEVRDLLQGIETFRRQVDLHDETEDEIFDALDRD
jgi:iron-sulfur cluster repair protein YtfE (RIC family)